MSRPGVRVSSPALPYHDWKPSPQPSPVTKIPRPQRRDYPSPPPDEPPLHRAARVGDHDEIRRLVQSGRPVDELFDIQSDPHARRRLSTPLMIAAGSGD